MLQFHPVNWWGRCFELSVIPTQRQCGLVSVWPNSAPVMHVIIFFLAALRVLKYLNIVKDRRLAFRGGLAHRTISGPSKLAICSDSDWATGSTDRNSYSGNAIHFNGDLVAWFIHEPPGVATPSTEAEYIAASDANKDGLGFCYSINKVRQVNLPMQIYADNQGAMFRPTIW